MENKSCKLAEITAELKVFNINAFNCYLKEIWIDLISRTEENDITIKNPHQNTLGITRLIFSKYYDLPGIIGDRLFRVFDSKTNDVLEFNEFKTGMNILFCEDYEKALRFIFDFYDFDGDGKISKEDIRIVLSYITYKNNDDIEQSELSLNNKETEKSVNYFYKKINKITKKLYESSVQNQIQLTDILEKCFQNEGELINYKSFTYIIDKINSDIFFMIYIFLLKNRPFSFKIIQIYDNIIKYRYSCASESFENSINIYNSIGETPNKKPNPYSYIEGQTCSKGLSRTVVKEYVNPLIKEFERKRFLKLKTGKNLTNLFNNKNNNGDNVFIRDGILSMEKTFYEAALNKDIIEELKKIKYNEEDYCENAEEDQLKNELLKSESNNYEGYIYFF